MTSHPVRRALARLAGCEGEALPPHLDAAVTRLDASGWPEVVWTWSRLTPSGFPVELTAGPYRGEVRWTAEVAGPELPEHERLGRAVALLRSAGVVLPDDLIRLLTAAQRKSNPRFGAWLGGREQPDADRSRRSAQRLEAPVGESPLCGRSTAHAKDSRPRTRLKLYAELPDLPAGLLPARVAAAWRRLPPGTMPRMLGVETGRIELYARLRSTDPLDLLPALSGVGHPHLLTAIAERLPDGLARLTGRRLGLSLAWSPSHPQVVPALFVSARTLFPGAPELLNDLIPGLPDHGASARRGLVTLMLDPTGRTLRAAVGLAPCPAIPAGRDRGRR